MAEQLKKFFRHILVAEDDPDYRLLAKQSLQDAGFAGNLQFDQCSSSSKTFLTGKALS
jgi:CheY-like chemotaxis protein